MPSLFNLTNDLPLLFSTHRTAVIVQVKMRQHRACVVDSLRLKITCQDPDSCMHVCVCTWGAHEYVGVLCPLPFYPLNFQSKGINDTSHRDTLVAE